MLGIENYQGFLLAVLVFQLVPGPGTVAILNATARHGARAGMRAVAGTLTGDFVFMTAAIAGLATVMRTNPAWFGVLRWAGVGYLCWSGARLLFSSQVADGRRDITEWLHYRQALAVSMTNPKVVLFFVAFFPLFLRPDSTPVTLVALMVHVTLISLLYQTALVFVGDRVAGRLRAVPIVRGATRRLAGVALIAFGAKLAVGR